jgi:transposase
MNKLEALQETSVSLYIAFELGAKKWLVLFEDAAGRVSRHNVAAGDLESLLAVLARVRTRFRVEEGARVVSCYEAGRDGFWLHRWLVEQGIENLVVDPASIEVDRRARRRKTDRLDAEKLLAKLIAHFTSVKRQWSVVRVPTPEQEDLRRIERERERLVHERSAHWARMSSLLVLHNVRTMPKVLGKLRQWLQSLEVGVYLKNELQRELERVQLLQRQIAELERQSEELPGAAGQQQRQLQSLRALGPISATTLTLELFGWRRFSNARQVGACAGLAPTPYQSGDSNREQGISKAGNKRLRPALVELSWAWLRYQPESELSRWYARRFGCAGARMRRIGIVALARRLLIALWRFLEHGVVPAGARFKAA